MTVVTQRDDPGAVHHTVRDLVDGFDRIADDPVPYGRLPARARTVYGGAFRTWADLADQTPETLSARPKAGITTVDAVLAAARAAAAAAVDATGEDAGTPAQAAVHRLMNRLDDYDRVLLSARGWALRPSTIPVTAARLDVSRNSVIRNQPRVRARLTELLGRPEHAEIVHAAAYFRQRFGPIIRERDVRAVFADLGLDLDADAGQLLLHVTGPYRVVDDWLETTTGAGGLAEVTEVIDRATRASAPTTAVLVHRLAALGVPSRTAQDIIRSRPGLRAFGDRWVHCGPTFAEKVVAALHLIGGPATAEAIAAAVGEDHHETSILAALYDQPRFVRVSKSTWGLKDWGVEEYTGLYAEIGARIDARPDPIPTGEIVADLLAAFPDVTEASVRSNLSGPGFVIERGAVRRRTPSDAPPAVAPLRTVRGVFRTGADEIRVALPVTPELLRGSGQVVAPALATALGVQPGERRAFSGPVIDLELSWRESSLNGAGLGSLRGPATTLGAGIGDTLVLVFDVRAGGVDVEILSAGADPAQRLRAALGRTTGDVTADLARALDCAPDEVADLLTRRGDGPLLPPDRP